MATFTSHNARDTESLGESWGRAARHGLVVALSGDLGAGKTALVRGLARGLGCTSRVHSPTFTLVNVYEGGRLPLDDRWSIVERLAGRAEDAADQNLPLMIWYAAEPMAAADLRRAVTLMKEARIPLLREFMSRRIASLAPSK